MKYFAFSQGSLVSMLPVPYFRPYSNKQWFPIFFASQNCWNRFFWFHILALTNTSWYCFRAVNSLIYGEQIPKALLRDLVCCPSFALKHCHWGTIILKTNILLCQKAKYTLQFLVQWDARKLQNKAYSSTKQQHHWATKRSKICLHFATCDIF